jgi:hypothetical protein
MKCARCKFWIYKGFEIKYQEKFYHQACLPENVRKKDFVTRGKKSNFRLPSKI